jgi:hypothetical protein
MVMDTVKIEGFGTIKHCLNLEDPAEYLRGMRAPEALVAAIEALDHRWEVGRRHEVQIEWGLNGFMLKVRFE